jgi:murein DD-endopeptidase MepM/ murein hydrolase activator NlpD
LIGLKKCLTLFLLVARYPAYWLWKGIFYPTVTLAYRLYLAARKQVLKIYGPAKDRAVGFFTSKYVIHAAVVILVFLVTATNIYAGEAVSAPEGHGRSILATVAESEDGELLLEEAPDEVAPEQEVSYLGGTALSTQEFFAEEVNTEETGTDDGEYDDAAEQYSSPFDVAVRVEPEAPTVERRPPTRTTIVDYTVVEGDTVASIAQKFGLRMDTVLIANGLGSRGLIRIGQALRILPVDGIVYKVKKGDTLGKIAKNYKSEVAKISEINGIAETTELAVGTELVLPGGKLPPPPAPKAPARLANLKDVFIPPGAADRVGKGKFLWPTAARRITQYFKLRHTGVDIAGPKGTPIYASDDGTVAFSGWNRGGYGYMIIVDHGNGLFTRYAHNSQNLVKVGDQVKRGDTIALMGSTGRSTGPHIHFEVMVGSTSRRVNPFDYIQ